jgi:hypothetical protein
MARLSRIKHRIAELRAEEAELLAQESRLFDEMAEGETVDLRSGRRRPKACVPKLDDVSETDRARATRALQEAEHRRRLRA